MNETSTTYPNLGFELYLGHETCVDGKRSQADQIRSQRLLFNKDERPRSWSKSNRTTAA